MKEGKIDVLIVDDSLTTQSLLRGILTGDPLFNVVGVATNGREAVDYVARLKPDVVSMDINMPLMDGLEATRIIMELTPVPIVIVSSQYEASDVAFSIRILNAGALTILPRPQGPASPDYQQSVRSYRNTLKMMAGIKVSMRRNIAPQTIIKTAQKSNNKIPGNQTVELVVIGASAGGPAALEIILKGLHAGFPFPILIVQHIDPHFVEGFCGWIKLITKLQVHIAGHGELLLPGHIYLPPGDTHLGVLKRGIAAISKDATERNLRPSVNYLFRSVAEAYGKNVLAILLSGMGADGATGLKQLHDLGAITIAQDGASALVNGMPGEAVKLGAAQIILSPEEILNELLCLTKIPRNE